jgi:hypothetical protein
VAAAGDEKQDPKASQIHAGYPVAPLSEALSQSTMEQPNLAPQISVYLGSYKSIQEDLKTKDLMTVIARQWSHASSKAERDLALFEAGRVLRLRYEDFVQDPISDMERICAHCGLQMTDDMAKTVKETVKTDRQLKWQRFEPDTLTRIVPELYEEMERYGYEVPIESPRLSEPIK